MTYRLSSLNLSTDFDPPEQSLDLPGEISRGKHPAMCILDAVVCNSGRVARIQRPGATLGLRVTRPTTSVDVVLELAVDRRASRMWHQFSAIKDEDVDFEQAELRRHRAVQVAVQGSVPHVALLARAKDDSGQRARTRVCFTVRPDQVPADGLLMVDLTSLAERPAFSDSGLLDDGLVGVAILRIAIRAARPTANRLRLSTGYDVKFGSFRRVRAGYVVLNPSGRDEPTVLEFRRGARRAPRQRLGRAWERGRRVLDARVGQHTAIEAATTDGSTVEVEQRSTPRGIRVIVPASRGPVFLRVRSTSPVYTNLGLGWYVNVVS